MGKSLSPWSDVLNSALLFADDTKIYTIINRHNPQFTLQEDIDKCVQWSMDWQLPFNVSKCKVLHLGQFNPNHSYTMADIILQDVFEEKDLGVIIDKDLKFHAQTAAVVNKANRLLGLIKKCFVNISIKSFIILYKSLVRPCLEYGNVIWGPFYVSDRIKLENIPRKATRMVTTISHLNYCDRLKFLKLPSL